MILIANSMKELDFIKLTELYKDDIEKARHECYRYMDLLHGKVCAENDLYDYLKYVFFMESHGVYYIYSVNGQYLSALRVERFNDGVLINALITDEAYRNKGYASILMKAVLQTYSCPIYAHIHRKNTASIKLHEKFGFIQVFDHAVMLDGTVCTDHITYILNH